MSVNDLVNTLPQDLTNDIIIPNIVSTESIFIQSAIPPSGAQGGKLFVSDGSDGLISNKLYFWESGTPTPEQVGEGGISIQNELVVKKNAGPGEFGTIAAALGYIGGLATPPSSTNRFNITIGPGDYVEVPLTIPSWIYVSGRFGTNPGAVNISCSVAAGTLFTLADGTGIGNLSITGLANAAAIGINCNIAGATTAGIALQNITINGTNGTGIRHTAGSLIRMNSIRIYGLLQGIYSADPSATNTVIINNLEVVCVPALSICIRLESAARFTIIGSNLTGVATGTGILIGNLSARLFMSGGSVAGCGNGISLTLSAGAARMELSGVEFAIDNTVNVNVLSTTAVGTINIIGEQTKVTLAPAAVPNFSVNVTGNTNNSTGRGVTIGGALRVAGGGFPTTDMTTSLLRTSALGIVSGGVVTAGIGLIVAVSAGTGYIVNGIGNLILLEWAQNINVNVAANAYNYVFVGESGTIQVSTVEPNLTTNVLLAQVITYIATIGAILAGRNSAVFLGGNQQQVSYEAFGPVYISGSTVASVTAGTQISINNGRFSFLASIFATTGQNPAVYDRIYSLTTINNISLDAAGSNLVPLSTYNNIVTGIAAIPALQYVSHGIYVTVDPAGVTKYFLRYGTAFFSTQAGAEGFTFSNIFSGPFVQIASVIVRQGTASIISIIDRRPFFSSRVNNTNTGVTEHNQLLGLTIGNDHPQYLLRAGTQPMTGALDMGGNNIINAGTVNAITVEAHAARHLPSGADPLTTAAPVNIAAANSIGTANSFARSDHVHNHADQLGGSLHAAATTIANGFMSSADKTKLDAATDVATASTLVLRDAGRGFEASTVRYMNSGNTEGINLRAPNSLAVSYNLVLPATTPVANQVLSYAGGSFSTGWTTFTNLATASTIMSRDTNADTVVRRLTLNEAANTITIISGATTSYLLTLPINAGSAGQALTTNGSGVTSWTSFVTGTTSTAAVANTIALRDGNADITARRYVLNNGAFPLELISGATSSWSLTFPINSGTNNQVLTTNGAGITSWSTVVQGTSSVDPTANTVLLRDGNADGFVRRINLRNVLSGTDTTLLADPNTSASFSLTLPTTSGASGQVLTTAGASGLLSWLSTAVPSTVDTLVLRGNDGSASIKRLYIDGATTSTQINPSTANITLGFPTAGTEIVTNTGTQTLTNKTLTSPVMTDFTTTGSNNRVGNVVGDGSGLRFYGSVNSNVTPSLLNFYQLEGIILNITGHNPATTMQTVFCRNGNSVTVTLNGVQGTITGATVLTTSAIPDRYLPGPAIGLSAINLGVISSNGGNVNGLAQLNVSTGVITFFSDISGSSFSVGASRGPFSFSWSWTTSRA